MYNQYNYIKTFAYNSPALAGVVGSNTQSHIVTIEDAIVKGFSIISLYANLTVWDFNAGNLDPITVYGGKLETWCNLDTVNIGVFGDSSNTSEVPAGWTRENFSFKANQQYYYNPGVYIPGNQLRFSFGFLLHSSYVLLGFIEYYITYVVQIGFQIQPAGALAREYRDESRYIDPKDIGDFIP